MAPAADALERARAAFARQEWGDAFRQLAASAESTALAADDCERLAIAAHLSGHENESREAWAQAHQEAIREGLIAKAARCAFWAGNSFMFAGEMGPANGWYNRGRRLLEAEGLDCVEGGYFRIQDGIDLIGDQQCEPAAAVFREILELAGRFNDPDLEALAGHGLGRALIRMGRIEEGMAALDEMMVAVTAGEVSPMAAGDVYCGVMEACHEISDLRRAREWTSALSRWCEGQPQMVAYRGPCMVYRTEVMLLQGAWEDALEEARRACEWLSRPPGPDGAGGAYYQLGELYRLRGEFERAEEAYRQASRLGQSPGTGLAMLRLARGDLEGAEATLRRAIDESRESREAAELEFERIEDPRTRSGLLAAQVEVMLAKGDVGAAREAAERLMAITGHVESPFLRALSARADGAVLLAEGQPRVALTRLRQAWTAMQKLDAPYEAARVRVLIGLAWREAGDEDAADMEFDAARWVFEQLGAGHDLARIDELTGRISAGSTGGLSAREIEVLRLVAAGKTNREIGMTLVISEHTVARHLQNIFAKVGVASRTELAAYAFQQRLV